MPIGGILFVINHMMHLSIQHIQKHKIMICFWFLSFFYLLFGPFTREVSSSLSHEFYLHCFYFA